MDEDVGILELNVKDEGGGNLELFEDEGGGKLELFEADFGKSISKLRASISKNYNPKNRE